jgi:hypothetical protein
MAVRLGERGEHEGPEGKAEDVDSDGQGLDVRVSDVEVGCQLCGARRANIVAARLLRVVVW